MKRGKKMFVIIVAVLGVIGLIAWGVFAYLGRSQTLSVKSIENPSGDLYLLHLEKPNNMTWEAGSYAQFTLPDVKESGQNSRFLTIASIPDENELLILTHNSGSLYKENLTDLSVGSKIEMSWLGSHLQVADGKEPLVCFASDVGIAAIRPIAKEWAGKRELVLSHLDKGVTVFDTEMAELANMEDAFTYESSASLSHSQEQLKGATEAYGNNAIYLLAGQPDDVEAMKKFLQEKGIDLKQIKVDSFKGLK
ncbi:ferredoxin reductase [Streptococcus rifensis]